jgi:hypothetical protein
MIHLYLFYIISVVILLYKLILVKFDTVNLHEF